MWRMRLMVLSARSARQARKYRLRKENPAVSVILSFLASDILCRPERLIALDGCLLTEIESLVGHLDVDLNAPLSADEE